MAENEKARHLREQEPGRDERHATAACAPTIPRRSARHHETADEYHRVVARLCPKHRVIICKDEIQWILQRREGERHGRVRWAGIGYFLTREALIRVSRASCGRIDPAALVILEKLPEHFPSATSRRGGEP